MFLSKSVLSALVGLLLWSGVSAAQCPLPDGLDGGPCCAQANLHLPGFPNFNQPSLEICWRDCNVNGVIPLTARWKNLNPQAGGLAGAVTSCGENQGTLELVNPAGGVVWSGKLLFQYSRTWLETDPSGQQLQVWRFLINGDLRAAAPLAMPCPIPVCAPAHGNNVRFTGYMDQARRCGPAPNIIQRAWMLTHACDFIDHAAGFPRGGVFHADRAYSLVGPAAGFVPGPLQPTEGTPGSPWEAMRRRRLAGTVVPPLPVLCEFEERLNFSLNPLNQFCQCGAPGTQQFLLGNLAIAGACGSTVTTPGGPLLPGFLSMGIGSWTIPAVFPGVEAVRWNAGNYNYADPCTGALQSEVFFGATTLGGYPAMQVVSPPTVPALLPLTFIDQSNSLRPPGAGTVMNVPYVSEHILNLNH